MKFEEFSVGLARAQRCAFREGGEGAGTPPERAAGGARPHCVGVFDVSGEFVGGVGMSGGECVADFPSQTVVDAAVAAAAAEMRVGDGVEVTPPTNRGVKFTLHGATITAFLPVDDVADLVASEYFVDFVDHLDRGLDRFEESGRVRFYDALHVGPHGMALKSGFTQGADHVSLNLPGEVFEVFGMVPFARLLARLQERGCRWHLTRCDAAWDDHEISPQVMRAAHAAGNFRSLTERKNWGWNENEEGQTFYFGKRGSSSFLRVYNRRGFNRLELECRENRSRWLGLHLVTSPLEKWGEVCMGHLRDFVDLVDAESGKCVSRRKLLPLWADFVGSCERIKVRLSDGLKTLTSCAAVVVERLKRETKRIGRQVAVFRALLGADAFKEWVDEGENLWESRHRVRAAEWKGSVGAYAQLMGQKIEDLLFDRARCLAL